MLAWLVALIAITPQLGIAFKISVGLTALLLIYEHAIVKPDDLSRVNVAFFQVNAVISVGLLLAGVVDVVISNSR
jgi:4-hydroxybenzoate polyprenyltransferase